MPLINSRRTAIITAVLIFVVLSALFIDLRGGGGNDFLFNEKNQEHEQYNTNHHHHEEKQHHQPNEERKKQKFEDLGIPTEDHQRHNSRHEKTTEAPDDGTDPPEEATTATPKENDNNKNPTTTKFVPADIDDEATTTTTTAATIAAASSREKNEIDDILDQRKYPLRYQRLLETKKLDPSLTEWPHEDELLDKPIYTFSASRDKDSKNFFISHLAWKAKCWYEVENFCVVKGDLILYHDPMKDQSTRRDSLRMCNEFSQRSPQIRLKYKSEPLPKILPGPLLENTPGWVLQFWCQDLFHSTLSLMPAFQTKLQYFSQKSSSEPDVYLKLARGRRKKGQYCHIKYGHPLSFNISQNSRWGGDKQFPFAGNPYWNMYGVLTKDPWRMHPLYSGATKKTACYRRGIVDKLYVKDVSRANARAYSDAQLKNLGVEKARPRECGKYRMTIIDRRGKTRKLTNIPKIIEIAKSVGFTTVKSVAFEFLTLQEQIHLITGTDLLFGVHGNGLTWQQFMEQGSCLIELVHTWYQPYAKLFGHSYFHSSMKNNPEYKKMGEYVPFAANETEVEELLRKAKGKLDSTSCGVTQSVDMEKRLDYMYSECAPHC